MLPIKWTNTFAFFVGNTITCLNGGMKCKVEKTRKMLRVFWNNMLPRTVVMSSQSPDDADDGNEFTKENESVISVLLQTPQSGQRLCLHQDMSQR